jgi:hypothetical protein
MSPVLSPSFVIVVAAMHAAAVALAGLGDSVAPRAAVGARWLVALVYLASVAWLAVRRDVNWTSSVLVGPPLALSIGLIAGMVALQFGWGERPGSPLIVLTACALPAVAVAIIAPALGALLRRALVAGDASS